MREAALVGSVLVVDDDAGVRALVRTLFEHARFAVEEAESGEEALELARRSHPDVVLLDVRLPGLSGYEVCRQLRDSLTDTHIIFLSGERTDPLDRVAGLLIGADDYLAKPFLPDELLARARRLIKKERDRAGEKPLTARERDVLRLLADGLSTAEIATALVVTRKTAGKHLEHILAKLGVHSRAQAIAEAYRIGLLSQSRADQETTSARCSNRLEKQRAPGDLQFPRPSRDSRR